MTVQMKCTQNAQNAVLAAKEVVIENSKSRERSLIAKVVSNDRQFFINFNDTDFQDYLDNFYDAVFLKVTLFFSMFKSPWLVRVGFPDRKHKKHAKGACPGSKSQKAPRSPFTECPGHQGGYGKI